MKPNIEIETNSYGKYYNIEVGEDNKIISRATIIFATNHVELHLPSDLDTKDYFIYVSLDGLTVSSDIKKMLEKIKLDKDDDSNIIYGNVDSTSIVTELINNIQVCDNTKNIYEFSKNINSVIGDDLLAFDNNFDINYQKCVDETINSINCQEKQRTESFKKSCSLRIEKEQNQFIKDISGSAMEKRLIVIRNQFQKLRDNVYLKKENFYQARESIPKL